jgi:hypothetical protein
VSKDGGPAFPVPHSIDGNWVKEPRPEYAGMSLRDYFAAHAGEPPPDFMRVLVGMGTFEPGLEWRIRWAWTYADAMLAAREEK